MVKIVNLPKRAPEFHATFNRPIWETVTDSVKNLFGFSFHGLNTTSILAQNMRKPESQTFVFVDRKNSESTAYLVEEMDESSADIGIKLTTDDFNSIRVLQTALEGLIAEAYDTLEDGTLYRNKAARDIVEIRVATFLPNQEKTNSYSLIKFS